MAHKLIYIAVEIKSRELLSRLLLAHFAMEKGYVVIIGRRSKIKRIAEKLKGGIFFYKSYSIDAFPNPKPKSLVFVVNDVEGFVYNSENDLKNRMFSSNAFEMIDLHLFSGNLQRNLSLIEYPSEFSKYYVIGETRFDIHHSIFRKLIEIDVFNKNIKEFILIITNFKLITDSLELKNTRFGEMIQKIIEEYPNMSIVIRPHPDETHWKYKIFKNNKVHIIPFGNVASLISRAKLVIHFGSTVGIEAINMGRQVILVNYLSNYIESTYSVSKRAGIVSSSIAETINQIGILLSEDDTILPFKLGDTDLFVDALIIDNQFATSKAISIIDDFYPKNFIITLNEIYKIKVKISLRYLLEKFPKLIIHKMDEIFLKFLRIRLFNKYVKKTQKFPYLSKSEIVKILSELSLSLNSHSTNYDIKEIDIDTYVISRSSEVR